MLTPTEKDELQKKAHALATEIRELKQASQQLHDQKEKLFSERSVIGKQISTIIRDIKQLRHERDQLTQHVKQSKQERNALTPLIREKIDVFKKTADAGKDLRTKGIQNPHELKRQIERLHYKIETEAPSFEKEKQIMKTIHDLEKKLKEAQKIIGAADTGKHLRSDIKELKTKADIIHATIQGEAAASQEKHEKLLALSKQVDELKVKEAELNAGIDAKKKELEERNAPIREKINQLNDIKKKLGEEIHEERAYGERQQKKKLSDLQKEVQEKIKKGEKLTTQDLLIMQSIDE